MYSLITLRALSALFQDWGITLGSLLTPLTTFEVQTTLRQRYPRVRDLQISCWAIENDEQRYCNRCRKCLRIAMMLLATSDDPASLGLDVEKIFGTLDLRRPDDYLTGSGHSVPYSALIMNLAQVRRFFPRARRWLKWRDASDPFRKLEVLVRRVRPYAVPWWGQYHPVFSKYLPTGLRERLDAIYREHWRETDPTDRQPDLDLNDAEVAWITETLRPTRTSAPR